MGVSLQQLPDWTTILQREKCSRNSVSHYLWILPKQQEKEAVVKVESIWVSVVSYRPKMVSNLWCPRELLSADYALSGLRKESLSSTEGVWIYGTQIRIVTYFPATTTAAAAALRHRCHIWKRREAV